MLDAINNSIVCDADEDRRHYATFDGLLDDAIESIEVNVFRLDTDYTDLFIDPQYEIDGPIVSWRKKRGEQESGRYYVQILATTATDTIEWRDGQGLMSIYVVR